MQPDLPALLATDASPDIPEAHRIYAGLIGDWDFEWRGFRPDGGVDTAQGEWFFRWVLDGWAVQDTWICPSRDVCRERGLAVGEWGTTLRTYDEGEGLWQVVWVGPRRRRIQLLKGRWEGQDILQEGVDSEGRPVQWNFTGLTPDSFRWVSQVSLDGGQTWTLLQEMIGHRQR